MSSIFDPTTPLQVQPAPQTPGYGTGLATRPCAACGQVLPTSPLLGTRYLACVGCNSAHSSEPIEDCQDGYYFHAGEPASADLLRHAWRELVVAGLGSRGPDGARLAVFGAGSGEFVPVAKDLDLAPQGFECSAAAVGRGQALGHGSCLHWIARFDLLPGGPTACIPAAKAQGFDRLWLPDLLEHFEEPGEVLAPAWSLLRPGGLLFGSTLAPTAALDSPQYHRHRFSPSGLGKRLHGAGFQVARTWEQTGPGGTRLAFAAHRDPLPGQPGN